MTSWLTQPNNRELAIALQKEKIKTTLQFFDCITCLFVLVVLLHYFFRGDIDNCSMDKAICDFFSGEQ